jgi:hypothetical protein
MPRNGSIRPQQRIAERERRQLQRMRKQEVEDRPGGGAAGSTGGVRAQRLTDIATSNVASLVEFEGPAVYDVPDSDRWDSLNPSRLYARNTGIHWIGFEMTMSRAGSAGIWRVTYRVDLTGAWSAEEFLAKGPHSVEADVLVHSQPIYLNADSYVEMAVRGSSGSTCSEFHGWLIEA